MLDDAAQRVADRYADLKATAKAAEDEARGCKEYLQVVLGGAALGTLPDGRRMSQKTVTRKSYTVAEIHLRRFPHPQREEGEEECLATS